MKQNKKDEPADYLFRPKRWLHRLQPHSVHTIHTLTLLQSQTTAAESAIMRFASLLSATTFISLIFLSSAFQFDTLKHPSAVGLLFIIYFFPSTRWKTELNNTRRTHSHKTAKKRDARHQDDGLRTKQRIRRKQNFRYFMINEFLM